MKKFMKNILAVIMVAAMAVSMAACSNEATPTQGDGADNQSQADGTDADTDTTEDTKVLIMGTNAEFPPYEFYEGQNIVGIDVEIAAAIAEKLGYDFRVEDMAFDSIIPSVISGKITFGMAGMTVTEERQQSVDFSDSYATGVQVVIVRENSEITTVDDLLEEGANYTIGVQNGTTGDLYATWDLEDEGLATVERYNKGADAVQALVSGKIDCVIIDNEPAREFIAAMDGLVILETEYAVEEYAMCFAKDSEMRDIVNEALNELIADGTVQAIIDKYISAE